MRAVLLAMVFGCGAAVAHPVSLRGAAPVDDARLADVRGGFTSPTTGLTVAIGVERAVYVNGEAAAQALGAGALLLVQRGAGNVVDTTTLGAAAAAAGTVVQNTLDGQSIQAVTTIDIKANSLATWNGLNLRTSVGNAITASLRR